MFDLQQWISSKPTIVVRGRQLMVVSNNTESSDKQTDRYPDAAVLVIAGSLAVLAFLVIFFIITSLSL